MGKNFQEALIAEVREFLLPIRATQGDAEAVFALLEMLGWYVRPPQAFTDAFEALSTLVEDFSTGAVASIESFADLRHVVEDVVDMVAAIDQLKQHVGSIPNVDPADLAMDLINGLAVLYIHRNYPLLFAILELLTVIHLDAPEVKQSNGAVVRIRNQFARLHFDRIGEIIVDTPAVLRKAYWPNGVASQAEAAAIAERLFPRVVKVLRFISREAPIIASFGDGAMPTGLTAAERARMKSMLSLWWDRNDRQSGLRTRLGASIGILSQADLGPGIFVVPFGNLEVERIAGKWLVRLSGACGAPGFRITRSGVDLYPGSGTVPQFSLMLAPEIGPDPGLLIGSKTGTRLEVKHYWIEADAVLTQPDMEVSVFLRLREGALVVGGGDGDGFLRKILPPEGLRVDFDLGLGWSNLRGFHIEGSGSFEFRVPLHLSLGPIEIPGLTIRAGFVDGKLPIAIGCDVTAKLGPLTAVVENMGVRLDLSFPPSGGNLGPVDWDPKFKPPSGIGLSIDGGGFKGGGFISFEPELDRYAGLLELEFQSGFALKAIGLLNTKLPGDVPGYSLLIIISAEFSPIQLSFGFTLNGVGGLLGLNRTTDIDALRLGVKTGALNSILFPTDIVEHAAQIISDLRQIFPPAADRFLFGPMAKIGWGTPTLVEIELGLMVEGMSPWRILLPGVVRLALPDKDNAIFKLQVNFLGTWEQDKKTITFYASLYDSSLLSMALTGDMAFLMKYGDNPSFMVAAGGFHPCFAPPLPFPSLARMALVIRNDDDLRIILSSYFAVTSNTAQFGCAVQLRASEGNYSIEGYLGFDALFHFSPFSMVVDIAATLTLRRKSKVMFGVQVYATLSGPTPWSVHGTATFTILKHDISFDFSRQWGEQRNTTLEAIDVFRELVRALENRGNWETIVPDDAQNLVTLKAPDPAEANVLVLRPDGALAVKQKVVPLDFTISMFGNRAPSNDRRFTIKRILAGGQPVAMAGLRDEFAPAQFESLSDADKVSRRSFETMPAGARMSSAGLKARTSGATARSVGYETKIIDSRTKFYYVDTKYAEAQGVFLHLLNGNSASRFGGSAYNAQYTLNDGFIGAAQEGFAVVGTDDLMMFSSDATFASQAEAHDYLAGLLANDPALHDAIQVVPNFQALKAA